ncbi:hypothetical protein HanRHA438_Chr07g0306991 [Helianthus annuus]|nr:hypothetical protein HanIR_Chr17g0883581 [Helianthus annuus]KAJ0550320.1 hypothetical protein HanHA300_Chr07g0244081 [Helianthus annuus]KAJ0557009.1 hypothetical protein HanIR_Chr07g0320281 [Helianthus annuus]KAJ0563274.1 hypothetical protein HanHA89_Chr07g0261261 [Helianthus annuus]KAJ0908131.1 hypothetical protein HanRHA438_Chr07g0306991 [Helianthus annuus]
MCEICGGPHFTVKCPQYEGSSARCDANPFMCQNCGIPHISIFCPYSSRYSTRYTNPVVQPQPYFSQGNYLQGYDNRPYYNDLYQQPQHNLVETSDRGFEGSMSRIEEMFAQTMTQMEQFIVQNQATLESMAEYTERNKKIVEELVRERGELEEVEEESDEEIIPVTETIMDDEVPPPVQKGIIYDFGSDSDDEIDEEEWTAYQRSLVKREVEEEEVELGDSTSWMFVAEEESEEVEIKSSGEDEVLESELIELIPYEETKCGDHPARVVEEEEHHNWPVVGVTEKSEKPREKARKGKNRDWLWVESWYKMEKKEPLKFKHDRSSHYMPRIRFLPGKFKFWWSDPFQNFKIFYNSTIKFLTIFEDRMELNGLDRVQVKEKPPD